MIDYLENPRPKLALRILARGRQTSHNRYGSFFRWGKLSMHFDKQGRYLIYVDWFEDFVRYLSTGQLS